MKGRRVYPADFSVLDDVEPGDYWKCPDGHWACACPVPRDEYGMILLGALVNHSVTEHEDGTITVHPSILCSAEGSIASEEWKRQHYYHGWLERGEWKLA